MRAPIDRFGGTGAAVQQVSCRPDVEPGTRSLRIKRCDLRAALEQWIAGMRHRRLLLRGHGLFVGFKLRVVNLGRLHDFEVRMGRAADAEKRGGHQQLLLQ